MQHIHWGISLPSKTPALPLFCRVPHKSESCQRLFHYSAVHVKIVYFSPEMLKNIVPVMGLFAHILAGKNFLLNK